MHEKAKELLARIRAVAEQFDKENPDFESLIHCQVIMPGPTGNVEIEMVNSGCLACHAAILNLFVEDNHVVHDSDFDHGPPAPERVM